MRVKLLNTTQAANLHKRFNGWFEIQPIPVKNGNWIISIHTLQELKAVIIDKVEGKPDLVAKAVTLRDAIKDLPTYDTDDFPNQIYDHENETELTEYTARFADLNFENVQ